MDYSINSDIALSVGLVMMEVVIALTIFFFILVIILRINLVISERKKKEFLDRWRLMLMLSVTEVPDELPKLDRRYIFDFLNEWNTLYEKLGGVAHDNLINIAKQLGVQKDAITMLISPHPKIQLSGIITLGNLRADYAWNILSSIALSDQTFLSMAAYRSLILIDGEKALDELLEKLVVRADWPATLVARILRETNTFKTCDLLEKAVANSNNAQLPNILKYINALNCPCSTNVFTKLLSEKHDSRVHSLCLSEINDPFSIPTILKFVNNKSWIIRVNAAKALGKVGGPDEVEVLKTLLHDDEWWVRYRAADSIAHMPFIDDEELSQLKDTQESSRARLILEQVIAERSLQ